jgi:hypothetical protein
MTNTVYIFIVPGRSTGTYRSANMHVLAVQEGLQNRVAYSQLTGSTEIAVTG